MAGTITNYTIPKVTRYKAVWTPFPLPHCWVNRIKVQSYKGTRMWANAQRDGRPAEHRWRLLFNAAKFGWRPILECRAVVLPRRETSWNLQGCPKLPDRSQLLVGRSSPYCGNMWRRYSCLKGFFPIVDMCLSCEDIAQQSCAMVLRWRFLTTFFASCIFSEPRAAHFRPAF